MITSKFFNMGQIVVTKSINDLMAAEQKFAVESHYCLTEICS